VIAGVFIFFAVMTATHFILKGLLHVGRNSAQQYPGEDIQVTRPLKSQVYFNNMVGATELIQELIQRINKAQHSIDIAIYAFNSPRLKNALYAAHARGIKVTLILNKSTRSVNNIIFSDLPQGITTVDAGTYDARHRKKTSYMHHKIILIDRGHPSQELLTGSFNFTDIGEKYVHSFFIVTHDETLITLYGKEFDLLKKGITGIAKLGHESYNPWLGKIRYANGVVEVWMGPGFSRNSVRYRILELIDTAHKSLDLIMWDITDRQIAQALLKKILSGVKVRIVAEDSVAENKFSILPYLTSEKKKHSLSNLEIILDTKAAALITPGPEIPKGFNPYMHHHVMIVDEKTVVFGSNNWSTSGFYHNDEDTLITDNAYITGEFKKTFSFFYETLK
jgi:phosphatidylserine/phosphatidylglycerophosphate/cardiolipin synthase-like enzyme